MKILINRVFYISFIIVLLSAGGLLYSQDKSNVYNIALNKMAFASSEYSSLYNAGNAFDENIESVWASKTGNTQRWPTAHNPKQKIYISLDTWKLSMSQDIGTGQR